MSKCIHLPSSATSTHYINSEAEQIRGLLKDANLSQRAAAKYLNVDERTVRAWCSGDGKPPPLILKALEFRAAYPASLIRMIESNERTIRAIQDGRISSSGDINELKPQANLLVELERLKKLNEEHRALLRLDRAFHRRQEAYLRMNEQWFPHGDGVPSEQALDDFDDAEQEFLEAKAECDRIARVIRTG